jgi:uncharacterized RmlC-like cupin family protein
MKTTDQTCRVVRHGEPFVGRQGLTYIAGLTDATVGSTGICLTVATLGPGARARAHLHRGIETAVYVIEGRAAMVFGPRLEHRLEAGPGEYCYVPGDMPHIVFNPFDEPCRAVVAHTAGNDQEEIVLLPDLDRLL